MSKIKTTIKPAPITIDAGVKGTELVEAAPKNPSQSDQMLMMIERASSDPKCDIEKMRALLDMKKEMVREEQRIAYNLAMHDAQAEMIPIVRNAWNDSTKSHFAKLEHVDAIVRPIYAKNGFSLSFDSRKEADGSITMFVDVLHVDGHEVRKQLNAQVDDRGPKGTVNKTQPQGVNSTTSILQRKLTVMVFNLTFINQDDDGQGGIKPLKKDRFAGDEDKGKKQEPKAHNLEEAAGLLESKLRDEPNLERRGKILMENKKLLAALDADGKGLRVAEFHKLAEEPANG